MRRQLAEWRGTEIDTTGDGFLATFDGPARAIRCACAARDAVRDLGLEIRAGLHTGEYQIFGSTIAGLTVHTCARVAALAGSGEVLVSSTVKDLVAGSGIELDDRGEHELKGVPGTWRIYAVRSATTRRLADDALVATDLTTYHVATDRYRPRSPGTARSQRCLSGTNFPPMHVFLETEHLVLRRFTEDDVDELVALDGDPEVMRYVTGGRPTSREEIETEVLPAFLGYYERYAGFGFWAVVEKSSGEVIGWFHFRPENADRPDDVELGYRLRRSAWGKGYATEGSRALVEKGFAELRVKRVYATTMVVNVASRRVMEKAGLRFVRAFHQPWPYPIEGDEEGDVEYALSRAEWEELGGE